jgi:hypothetical protein
MITLGLSVHRPEMVPLTGRLMSQHDSVFLEEPPQRGFMKCWREIFPWMNT